MKFRKSIIGVIIAAVISITAIAPCGVVYAETSKTASDENDTLTNFRALKTATSITLSWNEVKSADAYRVYMYNSTSGKYEKYKNVKKNFCEITGLSNGTKYSFKVSVLTKNNSKYKEKANSKSKSFSVTTKTSDKKDDNSSMGKCNIKTLLKLKMGTSEKSVLEKLGIQYYEQVGDTKVHFVDRFGSDRVLTEKEYASYVKTNYDMEVKCKSHKIQSEVIFTWKKADYKSTLCLEFKDKKLGAWKLSIPYSEYSEENDDLLNEIYEYYFDNLLDNSYTLTNAKNYVNTEKDDLIRIHEYTGGLIVERRSIDYMNSTSIIAEDY